MTKLSIKVTPKFNVREIVDSTIRKDWIRFQLEAFNFGFKLKRFMKNYINVNRKRSGGTGNLSRAITLKKISQPGTIGWGIGFIPSLNRKAPYWYVLNFGAKITGEKFIPPVSLGHFDGSRPDSVLRGKGTDRWRGGVEATLGESLGYKMTPKTPIRPINYIEATDFRLKLKLNNLLNSIKRG